MLRYAAVFFLIALGAAIFGFTGISPHATSGTSAAGIAQTVFAVSLVLAIVAFLFNLLRERP